MNEYKDRGIMKWAPFDALTGHGAMIEELIYNINRQNKRSLSEDEFEEINSEISKAIESNRAVTIEYFNDGYTYTTFGKITKCDTINKEIKLDTEEVIAFDSIMSLKCVR